ncbi:MAG: hypothetical protein R3Y09_06345 [Clostridia bacterium]
MNNLKKLKKTSVLTGIGSQILTIIVLFDPTPQARLFQMGLTVFISTIAILGILSNPNTKKKGFSDDIHFCEGCSKNTVHIYTNGKLICSGCGFVLVEK